MKTLKLSFEDAALEAFEAYAASVKMSPAEILGNSPKIEFELVFKTT